MSNILINLTAEINKYQEQLSDLDSFLLKGGDLTLLPITPLYQAIRASGPAPVFLAEILPKLSSEQRQLLLDLDFWQKDQLDLVSFYPWLEAYHLTSDEIVKRELVSNNLWALFLEAQFNIWTFDKEDPNYPDQDYYFLTPDHQLLFEYPSEFPYGEEVKSLIDVMYDVMGVESAYATLFKILADSSSSMQEENYRFKRSRLEDFGFIDYYDALGVESTFSTSKELKEFIKSRQMRAARYRFIQIDNEFKNELPPAGAVLPFSHLSIFNFDSINNFHPERLDYLRFNFTRLINSIIEVKAARKGGSVALAQVGQRVSNIIELGYDYLLTAGDSGENSELKIFDFFDFTDLFKIGHTLLTILQRKVKRGLSRTNFEDEGNEYFIGDHFRRFLQDLFAEIPVIKSDRELKVISGEAELLIQLLPFMQKMFESWRVVRESGRVLDNFYLNYTVSAIDFESIIISSFINHSQTNGLNSRSFMSERLGLPLAEVQAWLGAHGEHLQKPSLFISEILAFKTEIGLGEIFNFENYLRALLEENLTGIDFASLSPADWQHVGGPIILTL